ncbi:chromate transporter [Roseomonas sp. NAR14]|uniref:Chromate transporter n=1 Tax=Roseomonas acroporae TaxID=2937791 RepID=A0A9X2BWL8_9PROT|nr:chromate transporter [Roseomonas acroporae]MCK8785099.1 chromate transporter [Roseomonas acroporae]
MGTLLTLLLLFGELSLLAFGGGNTILPEMQRRVVEVHGWMSAGEFAALFALAQAAPGPNMMVCTLIGWRVAGLGGALMATAGIFLPGAVLTGIATGLWERFRAAPWRRALQRGLVPVTVGLVAASALLIAASVDSAPGLAAVTLAVAAVATLTRLHPLWLLGTGALLGLAGIGG